MLYMVRSMKLEQYSKNNRNRDPTVLGQQLRITSSSPWKIGFCGALGNQSASNMVAAHLLSASTEGFIWKHCCASILDVFRMKDQYGLIMMMREPDCRDPGRITETDVVARISCRGQAL